MRHALTRAPYGPSVTAERQSRGRAAEEFVATHLQRAGWSILERNSRPGGARGELDIVAHDGRCLVFVEVKARSQDAHAGPESPVLAVGARKQAQLRRLASAWLRDRPSGLRGFAELRFDVAGVWLGDDDSIVSLEYLRAAF